MSDNPVLSQILGQLTAIEQRLAAIEQGQQAQTGRMNDQFERVLNRLTTVESDLTNLRSEHSVTRDLVTKLPGTVLGAIEQPFLRRMTTIEGRVTKLEEGNQS